MKAWELTLLLAAAMGAFIGGISIGQHLSKPQLKPQPKAVIIGQCKAYKYMVLIEDQISIHRWTTVIASRNLTQQYISAKKIFYFSDCYEGAGQ